MTFSSLLTSRTPCHCFWQELSFVSTEGSLNPTYCTPDISRNSKLHLDNCADFCISNSKIYSLLSLLFQHNYRFLLNLFIFKNLQFKQITIYLYFFHFQSAFPPFPVLPMSFIIIQQCIKVEVINTCGPFLETFPMSSPDACCPLEHVNLTSKYFIRVMQSNPPPPFLVW